MALHEVQLKGYSVRPGNLSLGTFDSYGIEKLHVTLDDTWSGLAVTATFNPPEGEPVERRVPENGLIDVPAEATAKDGTGTIVYCGVANGVQRISKTQGYNVITHGNVGTTVPFNPSESLATQVLQAALSAEKNSAEANTAAESAASAAHASAESASKAAAEAAAAKPYAESAKASAKAARNSENQAQQSSTEATTAKNAAQNAQAGAESSATAAAKSAKEASASKTAAANNAIAAKTSEDAAAKSAADADNTANSIKDSMTQITANKEAVSQLKKDLGNKITKFYASNQGENHLADSDNGKIQDMVVYGKSSQNETTGKNLLKIKDTTKTVRGVTITSKDGIITVNGTATETGWAYINIDRQILADGTYIANYEAKNNDSKLLLADVQGRKVIEQNIATALSNAEINKVCFIITKGNTYNMTDVKVQLELGSSATSYEPYTGGQPSPSPDYPQEIKSVVNPTVKVCGKNLLEDGSLKSDNNGKIEYISAGKIKATASTSVWYSAITNTLKLTPNTNYVLSAKCDSSNGRIACNSVTSTGAYIKCAFLTDSDGLATIAIRCRYESGESQFVYSDLQLEKGSTATAYEPYTEQTDTLPYTLNAIPVSSGGNVTIDGQRYVADYVDVERGKLVKMVDSSKLDNTQSIIDKTEWLLAKPQEIDLTTEEITAFKALVTYYPTTNISVNSEQLDGYTVFNYPISMANGWNYVKQQLNDNRDYIYDIDLQSAEAYVNSEYAVALTELEV